MGRDVKKLIENLETISGKKIVLENWKNETEESFDAGYQSGYKAGYKDASAGHAASITESNLNEGEDQKRYVASIEIYVYGKDDTEAITNAQNIAKDLDRKYDNHAKVQTFGEMPSGGLGRDYREIPLTENNENEL